jgi:hypothetical protein
MTAQPSNIMAEMDYHLLNGDFHDAAADHDRHSQDLQTAAAHAAAVAGDLQLRGDTSLTQEIGGDAGADGSTSEVGKKRSSQAFNSPEKRTRVKEQNRKAAERSRQKKRDEL